jgi:long-chain acyl-CoA synthetase
VEPFSPEYTDLASLLSAAVAQRSSAPFLGRKRGGRWEWVTFGDFDRQVASARALLAGLGVTRRDRVAVISNNRLEWAACAFASWTLGAVYVPMYEMQLERDWHYILRDCGAKVCFVSTDAVFERIAARRADLPALEHLVGFDRAPTDAERSFAALVERAHGKPVAAAAIAGADDAVFIYTSGTTGNPKGVRLSHANVVSNVCATKSLLPPLAEDRGMCILPWAHIGGTAELLTLVCNRQAAGICEGPDKIAENLAELKPTFLITVPRVWHRFHDAVEKAMSARPKALQRVFRRAMRAATARRLGQPLSPRDRIAIALAERMIYPKIRERLGGRMRFAVVGAAALSVDVAHFIENLGIRVHEAYGMTEASPIVTAMRPDDVKLGSVGRVIPGVRIEIDHDVDGGDAEQGEIIVHGHGVMQGYHGLPDETARVLRSDGGLRTGDIGRVDGEGFLYITGRVREVYKLENGKFVAPVPIEDKICLSPYIAQAMVHGLNRPHNVAVIVVDKATLAPWCEENGVAASEMLVHPKVKALLAEEIARETRGVKSYERVVDFVVTADEFSTDNDMLTPTLKLKRRNVLARHDRSLAGLYAAGAGSS